MENSLSRTEEHTSFHSPPRRRRSTFFERRDSIVHYNQEDDVDNNMKEEVREGGGYTEYMNTYYLNLLSEKDSWKKVVKDRRYKYHELKDQYQMAVATSSSKSTIPFGVLTNEDIEFIKAKPDISKLVDAQQKLHQSLLLTREFVKRNNELDNIILEQSEDIVNKVTDYILEHSTIEDIE